jgi:NodT family efflux transporter outer membrane factor (OMF) lipoprotein
MNKVVLTTKYLAPRIAILTLALFHGCANHSSVKVEDLNLQIPEIWQTQIPDSEKFTGKWWEIFKDDELEIFILDFQKNSPDLRSIIDNKNMAYQSSKINGSGIFPYINGSVSADTSVQNLSGFGVLGSFLDTDTGEGDSSSQTSESSNEVISFGNTTAGLGLSLQWELDIWGRLLNGRKAAQKNYEAISYDLSYLGFSTVIRATQSYFQAVEAYGQMMIAQDSYDSFLEIRDLVKDRYERGLRSSLDYRLAETSVSTSKVLIEVRQLQLRSLNRRLEILSGKYPKGDIVTGKTLPVSLPNIESVIPAELLIRRPDIKSLFLKTESEGFLLAQSKRNLFPGISLNSRAGTSAQKLEDIFNDDYGIWSMGFSLTAPIFNAGKLRAAAKLQESAQRKSKKELLKGLLNAFSEVEQLLELDTSLLIQQEAINVAVRQSSDAYNLSKERYDKGVTTLESVLNTQRQYNDIRSQYLMLSRQRIENRLSLILALGGETN